MLVSVIRKNTFYILMDWLNYETYETWITSTTPSVRQLYTVKTVVRGHLCNKEKVAL